MKGGSKEYWFVLTAESLSWYKDEEVSGWLGGAVNGCSSHLLPLGGALLAVEDRMGRGNGQGQTA